MECDDFEWDDAKAEANFRKHRISFRDARRVFDDPFALIEQDLTGEDRFLAAGLVEGVLITVTYTERGDCIRIISARKANTVNAGAIFRRRAGAIFPQS